MCISFSILTAQRWSSRRGNKIAAPPEMMGSDNIINMALNPTNNPGIKNTKAKEVSRPIRNELPT
jgi:hypothetical protein